MTALIPIEDQVDLINLSRFHNLKVRMERERQRYYKLYQSSMAVASRYLDELPESKTIIRLRREIRLATRGTPLTIASTAITSAGYISAGTEQLYNAQAHLVKSMYRKIAPLVHPDRGGDPELFQLALAAYRMQDLTFLQDLFWKLTKDNVFWRSSTEALEYMEQEIKRPEVSVIHLRSKPEFQIVMLHQSGKPDQAREFASAHARLLVLRLQRELNHLLVGDSKQTEQDLDKPNVGEANGTEEENGGQGPFEEDRNDEDLGESWSGQ